MVSDVTTPPAAKSFCIGGLSRGEFKPYIKHACSPIADPYANLTPPEDGPCINVKKLKGSFTALPTSSTLEDSIGSGTVMVPGTYCKGLKIEGVQIRFTPGTYVIKGKLEFKKFATAVARMLRSC